MAPVRSHKADGLSESHVGAVVLDNGLRASDLVNLDVNVPTVQKGHNDSQMFTHTHATRKAVCLSVAIC